MSNARAHKVNDGRRECDESHQFLVVLAEETNRRSPGAAHGFGLFPRGRNEKPAGWRVTAGVTNHPRENSLLF